MSGTSIGVIAECATERCIAHPGAAKRARNNHEGAKQ
jgi:hypothetical protein